MKKILFVEDEATMQKTITDALTGRYELISAMDGKTGLDLVRSEKPDLVLLDIILPKMNGFEVLKEIKKDPKIKDIPVIILTNLEGPDEVNKALELGATTYLIKSSYGLEELIKKIRNILG